MTARCCHISYFTGLLQRFSLESLWLEDSLLVVSQYSLSPSSTVITVVSGHMAVWRKERLRFSTRCGSALANGIQEGRLIVSGNLPVVERHERSPYYLYFLVFRPLYNLPSCEWAGWAMCCKPIKYGKSDRMSFSCLGYVT